MVGCKDDPSHKLRHLPSLRLRSPTQDEQHTRVSHWLHTVADTPSNKRHALAELGPSYPRKSARLAQKQRVSAYKMPTSPFKKQVAGKGREGTRHGEDENEAEASVDHVITRSRAQGNVPTASSSEKENRDRTQRATTLLPRPQGAGIIIPLRRPNEILVPPELGSPSKRKDPSSRPSSPTKTTSKSSKKPALVDKRERLELLNPPVKFLSLSHLGKLGKNIPALLRDLWVDHIYSNGEGFIPQALKVHRLFSCTRTDTNARYPFRQESYLRLRTNRARKFKPLALQATLVIASTTTSVFGRLSRMWFRMRKRVGTAAFTNRIGYHM